MLHFTDQRVQAGQAQADHALALFHGLTRAATGAGRLAGIPGHLLDGGFQFAQGVTDLRGIAGLALGTVMQTTAQLGEGAAAAGHFLGIPANGAHQVHQVGAQAIQGGFDVVQFTVGLAQRNGLAEVALGPGGQGWRQVGQYSRQAPLQGVDQQRDQQDQADHHTLHQADFALDLGVLRAHHGFQAGDGLLYGGDFQLGACSQCGALLDLLTGALEFGGVAGQQAVEFALEVDAGVLDVGFSAVFKAHHG